MKLTWGLRLGAGDSGWVMGALGSTGLLLSGTAQDLGCLANRAQRASGQREATSPRPQLIVTGINKEPPIKDHLSIIARGCNR